MSQYGEDVDNRSPPGSPRGLQPTLGTGAGAAGGGTGIGGVGVSISGAGAGAGGTGAGASGAATGAGPGGPGGFRRATSQWSESYFPSTSPTAQRRQVPTTANSSRYPSYSARRSAVRSSSVTSVPRTSGRRRRGDGAFSEEEEDADNFDEDDEDEERERERDRNPNARRNRDRDRDLDEDGDVFDEDAAPTPRVLGRDPEEESEDPITMKERQSLINIEHPFGLPIWKPALYRKSRTVTREAETALHGVPSAAATRDLLLPGNILWTVLFGWWLSICIIVPSAILSILPFGGSSYAPVVYGLGWYLFWPFGRYVEGDLPPSSASSDNDDDDENEDENEQDADRPEASRSRTISVKSADTIRHNSQATLEDLTPTGGQSTIRPARGTDQGPNRTQSSSWATDEHSRLLSQATVRQPKSYGTIQTSHNYGVRSSSSTSSARKGFGKLCYYYFFLFNIAPLLLIVCTICWACVFTIPMAKLLWELLNHMFFRPEHIRFCSAPKVRVASDATSDLDGEEGNLAVGGQIANGASNNRSYAIKRATLHAGQLAPSGKPDSTVLLCIYRAVGARYYKYTVGGVNIFFVNLIPVVFFVIFDGMFLMPLVEKMEHRGEHVPAFLAAIASQLVVFILSLASVIPLSYFIGMAVASISAQSSIGMGAVINATFGSIIEIILYGMALIEGKGRLVEGSIVGSILAGVLLMPGASMCSSALRRKEQGFNAKSASVTSTMLIMAIFGTLTPTLFYQTYGNFELVCDGCPDITIPHMSPVVAAPGELTTGVPWACKHCYYQLPDPTTDAFYQDTVKPLMYFCATILVLSYLIGLWFSLRTHASQIWQNPRQLMEPHPLDMTAPGASGRMSLYHRLLQMPSGLPTHLKRKPSVGTTTTVGSHRGITHRNSHSLVRGDGIMRTSANQNEQQNAERPSHITLPPSPTAIRRLQRTGSAGLTMPAPLLPSGVGYTPIIETVSQAAKAAVEPMNLPAPTISVSNPSGTGAGQHQHHTQLNLTTDEFTRAVAVATVSALRQGVAADAAANANRLRGSGGVSGLYDSTHLGSAAGGGGGHGGHEAPSWSRFTSASVLLSCTLLYAIIAEILVKVVDVVLEGSGIDEKFLGITLFALVPNTTEFMNAVSFAINGNISLSMEIGSAYALQVCLLQIPAMVAFSAWYDPRHMGTEADTFTLIFPRWDVIAIILSIFLLTYTYIEAKSNYHRGSILILSYLVMVSGFYFAPSESDETRIHAPLMSPTSLPSLTHAVKTLTLSLFTR